MTDREFKKIRKAFNSYAAEFQTANQDIQQNFDLKRIHSLYVAEEATALARSLGLNNEEIRWARIMGLLHDVGRFEQYRQYQTFVDSRSQDHAALSVAVLKAGSILDGQPRPWIELLLKAISYHNRYQLPASESPEVLFYTRLLRDADKLDIFRVVTEYYHRDSGPRNPAIELGLPDTPEVSPGVLRDLQECRSVDKRHVCTLNDFKLLQVGWVYDVNFPHTGRQILQRNILDRIEAALPQTSVIQETFETARRFLAGRADETALAENRKK